MCWTSYRTQGLSGTKPSSVPINPETKLTDTCAEPLVDANQYRWLMGRLLYLNFTRPDISFSVNYLSQFMHRLCKPHMDCALQVLAYLKGTFHHRLFYSSNSSSTMECYTDVDYANCPDTPRSISGNTIFLGKNLVSWRSKKQPTVPRSSAEAEYQSMGLAVSELLWISYLMKDLKHEL